MNICIIAVGASQIIEIDKIRRSWGADSAASLSVRSQYVGSDLLGETEWPSIFQGMYASDFVLLDTMGVPTEFDDALTEGLAGYKGHVAVVNATSIAVRSLTRLGGFSLSMMKRMGKKGRTPDAGRMMKMVDRLERLGSALPVGPLRDMRNFFWISRYWLAGNRRNLENMLYLIGREYFGRRDFPKPLPPVSIEDCTILDPASGRIFKNADEFHAAFPPAPEKPGLGLLFRSRPYPLNTHPVMGCMLARLSEFFTIIPIALDSTLDRDFAKLRAILMPNGKPAVDILINPESFRLAQGPMGGDAAKGIGFLRELDVPVLHPFLLTKRTLGQWRDDAKGAGTGEFLISIFLPELDGCIEMYPIAAVGTPQDETPELAPIDERIERLTQRARNWSALRNTPNSEKRVALILYNYPPDSAGVGSSAFLDTFASIAALLGKLAGAGYDLIPLSADEIRDAFVGDGRRNTTIRQNLKIDAASYRALTQGLPGREEIDGRWGVFPGGVMSDSKAVVLPGIMNGKIFIGLQPPRTIHDRQSTGYHDRNLPPHHQYVAFYRWLARDFKAHAIVHVGTHGTLEFLPGKEQALSGECFPDALVGAVPHLYMYYSGNPSEAMIARRRSHAVVIGHLPPPFTCGGLYDELQALNILIQEHSEACSLNPGRCLEILEDIRQRVEALGWPWTGLDGLHHSLHEMKTALAPSRLHTLGTGYSEEETIGYLSQLLRYESPAGGSLHEMLAVDRNLDWQMLVKEPHRHEADWDGLEQEARQWIERHIINGAPLPPDAAGAELALRGEAIAKALMHNSELDELLHALGGRYIQPGPSGDLFRCPEILPTGRNLVQFDPRAVPSPSALRRGAEIAANTIDRYKRDHGRYPLSTAVVLWGLETSQTQGETIGQILAYLGLRVVRESGQWLPRLELMPPAELGRPRVDVTVQICGFFRDMFPNVLSMLQQAFSLAGFADEPDEMNYVRAHARLVFSELRSQGMQEADAREFSLARVFGPPPAEYGTSVEKLVQSRAWRTEGELVSAYVESLKHAYTPGHYGKEMSGLLTGNLSRVEVVSQVRGSRDYEMTDLDHYFEFYGGLARSVEQASGKKALMLVSDSHEAGVRTEDVKEAVTRGIHSRLINPVWLDGMLGHSHHGGHEIAKRMENLIGLAATTGAVDQASFDRVSSRLVFDDSMRRRIQDNNPYAMLDIIKRLWEAHTRDYWSPDEATLEKLKQLYMDAETQVEGALP